MKRLLIPAVILANLAAATPSLAQKTDKSTPAPTPLATAVDGLPIGAIPKQELPEKGCAAFLWTKTPSGALVVMLTSDPAQIRFAPGGVVTDLVRTTQSGLGGAGFAGNTEYAGADLHVVVDMEILLRDDLKEGAAVPVGTLRVDRVGQDSIIVPVAGIIGCSS